MRAHLSARPGVGRVAGVAAAGALVALSPAAALAHAGRPLAPHDLWSAWTWAPGVVLPLALSAALYARGLRALWHAAGRGRGVRRWQAGSFAAGWLLLAAGLVSPLHAVGEVLLSAHMVQHELLMAAAAPLLVLGRPLVPFVWGLPLRWRRASGRWARQPLVSRGWRAVTGVAAATLLHAAAIWLWHAPALYQHALRSEGVHAAQHASFLLTALVFWWAVLHAAGSRSGAGASVLGLFATMLHTTALGALLFFTSSLWFPAYSGTTGPWGLTPIEDQQLAGLIMWIPSGFAYVGAALALFAGMLRDAEWRVAGRERQALAPGGGPLPGEYRE